MPNLKLRHKRPPGWLHRVRGSWGAVSGSYRELWNPARVGVRHRCVVGGFRKGISSRECLLGRGGFREGRLCYDTAERASPWVRVKFQFKGIRGIRG